MTTGHDAPRGHLTPTDADRAYAAGFLDGEGSISLYEYPSGKSRRVMMRVAVANTDLAILAWFKDRWGGSVTFKASDNPKWSDSGQWIAHSNIALAFLLDVQPFAKIKTRQIENAVLLQRSRHSNGRYSASEWASFRELIIAQRALNARGPAGG